jgi:hypothetical protein
VATDPDEGTCFANWPMLDAVKKIPMNAKITASGSAPPANGAPNGIDAAIAAAGAMEQID